MNNLKFNLHNKERNNMIHMGLTLKINRGYKNRLRHQYTPLYLNTIDESSFSRMFRVD